MDAPRPADMRVLSVDRSSLRTRSTTSTSPGPTDLADRTLGPVPYARHSLRRSSGQRPASTPVARLRSRVTADNTGQWMRTARIGPHMRHASGQSHAPELLLRVAEEVSRLVQHGHTDALG